MEDEKRSDYESLRTEWLRLKSYLFDGDTDLPALPCVLDEVRKLMEAHNSIGVVYLEVSRRVEGVYGWYAYDRLMRRAARVLKSMKGALPPGSLLAMNRVREGEFLIVLPPKKSPEKSFNARLEKLARGMLRKLKPLTEKEMTPRLFPGSFFHCGWAVVPRDPLLRFERLVYQGVRRAEEMALRHERDAAAGRLSLLEQIIAENQLSTVFQPIVYLDDLNVFGYEALARVPGVDYFNDAEVLFSFAVGTDLILQLERLCRRNALENVTDIGKGVKLFINTSANAIDDPELREDRFIDMVREKGLDSKDVVLEITERLAIADFEIFRKVVAYLKQKGFSIAIDDMGAGYSSLQTVAELRPHYLKYDMNLVRDIDKHLIKRDLLETLVPFAKRIGATLIAEGIETREEFETLKSLGIELGQGYYVAKPGLAFPRVSRKNSRPT